ncbi:MAG TPA: hypothetical protein VM534_04470 [Thermoanaerobaculia bacterium]|nr:hypothetical protein [Thermoanaerobaculia bacterium]
MKLRRSLLIPMVIMLFGCGGGEAEDASATPAVTPEASGPRDASPAAFAACDLLTPTLLASHYSIDAAELQPGGSQRENFCAYRWNKPDHAAILEENRKALINQVNERMEAMRRGETYQAPPARRAENEVTLSLPPSASTADQAARQFETIQKRLSGGMTVAIDEETRDEARRTAEEATGGRRSATGDLPESVTFQADTVPVKGVGDRAFWAPSLHQLTVLSGTNVFHLGVQVADDPSANLEEARSLAPKIIEQF